VATNETTEILVNSSEYSQFVTQSTSKH